MPAISSSSASLPKISEHAEPTLRRLPPPNGGRYVDWQGAADVAGVKLSEARRAAIEVLAAGSGRSEEVLGPVRTSPTRFRLRDTWGVAFGIATAVALIHALPDVVYAPSPTWSHVMLVIAREALPWFGWALLMPAVLGLVRVAPLGQPSWPASLLLHGAASVVISTAKLVVLAPLSSVVYGWEALGASMPQGIAWLLAHRLAPNIVLYGIFALGASAMLTRAAARERSLTALQLQSALADAELRALRGQLEPHFLFNALNTVTSFIQSRPQAAEMLLAQISDLLRLILRLSAAPTARLGEELQLTQRYVDVQRLRLGGRLSVEFTVPPSLHGCRVPSIVLQPLVENALKHGIDGPDGPEVVVSAADTPTHLVLTVTNLAEPLSHQNGGATAPSSSGIGLANLRARCEALYGDAAQLTLRHHGSWVTASLSIPHVNARVASASTGSTWSQAAV